MTRSQRLGLVPKLTALCAAAALGPIAVPGHAASNVGPIVTVGGRVVPFIVTPYYAGGGIFAPADLVKLFGGSYEPKGRQMIRVHAASGKEADLDARYVQGRMCVNVEALAAAVGGACVWTRATQTIDIRSKLAFVRVDGSTVSISTGYPIIYTVGRLDAPARLFIDLQGTDLAASAATVPVSNPLVARVRSKQMTQDTVRIVLDLKHAAPFTVRSAQTTDRVLVSLGAGSVPPDQERQPAGPVAPTVPPVISRPLPPVAIIPIPPRDVRPPLQPAAPAAEAATVTDVRVVKNEQGEVTQVAVDLTKPARYRVAILRQPDRLAFDVVDGQLSRELNRAQAFDDSVLRGVRAGVLREAKASFGRIVLDLSRPIGYQITAAPNDAGGTTYSINFAPSSAAVEPLPVAPPLTALDHGLAGRVIMVDPGHGGEDSGAVGPGPVYEKDLTLAIGLKLRSALQAAGATVYMTRDTDILPSLALRPRLGVSQHADIFVSVHCDYFGPLNSHSGTTVYFHAHKPICRELAADISAGIGQSCSLPPLGTKSDTIRFRTGFAVLRGSPMPAVLVECGYMNNTSDLEKLRDEAVQQNVCTGIVQGLVRFAASHPVHGSGGSMGSE